jgi:hypothetical protein
MSTTNGHEVVDLLRGAPGNMKTSLMKHPIVTAIVFAVLGTYQPLFCSELSVTVDTSQLATSTGFVAFDFIGGTPVENNTAIVAGFTTDGLLGAGSPSGSVLGTLTPGPLTLTDVQFFNEWLQPITYGSTMAFHLTLSTNTSPGGIPDAFSFFLLDNNQIPFASSDPSGANSLFEIDLNSQSIAPNVFLSTLSSVTVTSVGTSVPEVSSVWLMLSSILIGSLVRKMSPYERSGSQRSK